MSSRPPFFGRARELGALAEAIAGSGRVVTIVGPPGIGKTRLAREHAAAELAAVFVDLAPAATLGAVEVALADALGVPDRASVGAGERGERMVAALASRGRVVVLLDNFDRLVDCAAGAVECWRDAAPDAVFLVTSRQRLGVAGECCLELGPLADDDAVELFVSRARLARGDVALARDRAAIAGIVRRLDGIPLAIELAAARMGLFSAADLLGRLDARFALLCRGPADADDRHATLERAIALSWELLAPGERAGLGQLSVFPRSFSIAAAEAVVGPGEALAVVDSLLAKSLLWRAPDPDGAVRFCLYESVREFAAARATDRDDAERRLADHVLAAGEASRDRGDRHLDWLRSERDNLLAVARWCAARDAQRLVRIALLVDPLLARTGPLALHLELLDAAVAADGNAGGRVLAVRAEARRLSGLAREARDDLERALALADARGETAEQARLLVQLGLLHRQIGNWDDARECMTAALERAADHHAVRARALCQLGVLDRDVDRLNQALGLAERIGDPELALVICANLGQLHGEHGRHGEAEAYLARAAGICRTVGDRVREPIMVANQGMVAHRRGDVAAARELYAAALPRHAEVGDRLSLAVTSFFAAMADHELGELDAAEDALVRAQGIGRDLGNPWIYGFALAHRAALAATRGWREEARRLIDEARRESERSLEANLDGSYFSDELDLIEHLVELAEGAPREAIAARARPLLAAERRRKGSSGSIFFARRLVERRLSERARVAAPAVPPGSRALEVAPGSRWIRFPGGERVDLASRAPLRRFVSALVAARIDRPGTPVSVDALVEASWPGERLVARAAHNRVYNAIATLRRFGLRDLLITRGGGYLLDPAATIATLSDPE